MRPMLTCTSVVSPSDGPGANAGDGTECVVVGIKGGGAVTREYATGSAGRVIRGAAGSGSAGSRICCVGTGVSPVSDCRRRKGRENTPLGKAATVCEKLPVAFGAAAPEAC